MKTRSLLAPLLSLTLVACAEQDQARVTGPQGIPIGMPPTDLSVVTLTLETYLWRDFMPPTPPEGRPLRGALTVRTMDGSPLPQGLIMSSASVHYQGETWVASPFGDPSPDPSTMVRAITGGPLWGPDVRVDVTVLLVRGRERIILNAKNQLIHRTD
ncbi:MAG TPA: hypothetical protein VJY35_15250 [Candidatus Eisenbacteria bacterium]|nr:hypothetical protein [Candidatus Eisenbacteria bacterium]